MKSVPTVTRVRVFSKKSMACFWTTRSGAGATVVVVVEVVVVV
jgi:hypothetical protein